MGALHQGISPRVRTWRVFFCWWTLIPPMKDLVADWLIEHNVPFTIFTKCDRDKPGMPSVEENQAELERRLMEKWHHLPSMIPLRCQSGGTRGRAQVHLSIILFDADAADAKAAAAAARQGAASGETAEAP